MGIFLKPIAMVHPSEECTQAPSRIQPAIELSDEAFALYADTAEGMLISFADDGVSDPVQTTVYTLPSAISTESGNEDIWPGRYILDSE